MKSLLFIYLISALSGIVPQPQSVEASKGSFQVRGTVFNCECSLDKRTQDMLSEFVDRISLIADKTSSFSSSPSLCADSENLRGICFFLNSDMSEGEYSIEVTPKYAKVFASGYDGFLYATQTLRQLLPVEIYGTEPAPKAKWVLPCCKISDKPRFGYRGLHLDCVRHFFDIEEVYRYLEIMNVYKLNRLHWHLSDDQGWRVEIKKYPLLTVVGAYRSGTQIGRDKNSSDGVSYGGFYTQEQIREIVAYATKLGITIIPEIDLPGHMLAALSAYPELGCTGGPYKVWTRWGISDQVLCPGKEEMFTFLEGVFDEICELFPSEYIHIGGDECPKTEWEKCPACQAKIQELGLVSDEKASKEQRLQNYVMARVQKYLALKGRKIIGWDEILEGDLAEGSTIMSWRGTKGGLKAASRGFDVIMAPNTYCYIDYAQSTDLSKEPLGITKDPKRAVTLEKIYGFNPTDGMDEEAAGHILGAQANLWTEYIAPPDHLEYMLLPRLQALSEVQWCDPTKKDFARFREALSNHQLKILEVMGYNYRPLD